MHAKFKIAVCMQLQALALVSDRSHASRSKVVDFRMSFPKQRVELSSMREIASRGIWSVQVTVVDAGDLWRWNAWRSLVL